VHFLGFRSDIPSLMSLANVVVHTSVAPEPFGRVLVEGMFAKRPVVATRAGGALEIIEDGTSGVLVPPADPGALAHALAQLLGDPAQASRIAANGHMRACGHFSLDAMLAKIEQTVDGVLARGGSPQATAAGCVGCGPQRSASQLDTSIYPRLADLPARRGPCGITDAAIGFDEKGDVIG
jgi:hypothetical protein